MLTVLSCLLSLVLGIFIGANWRELGRWLVPDWTWRLERTMRPTRNDILGIALLVVMVLGVVVGIMLIATRATVAGNDREQREFQKCTADYQQDFVEAYTARADASIKTTRALDGVVKAVDEQDPAAFSQAVDHYLQVRADQTKERAENPLPAFPEKVCGSAPED